MHDVKPGHGLEHLSVEVGTAAHTRRSEIQSAGFAANQLQQLGYRFDTQRRGDHQHIGHARAKSDTTKIFQGVVRQLFVKGRVDGVRCRSEEQSVAIGICRGHSPAADRSAGTRPVVHNHRLPPCLLDAALDLPGHNIDLATGHKGNNDPNGFVREPVLRPDQSGKCQAQGGPDHQVSACAGCHLVSCFFVENFVVLQVSAAIPACATSASCEDRTPDTPMPPTT